MEFVIRIQIPQKFDRNLACMEFNMRIQILQKFDRNLACIEFAMKIQIPPKGNAADFEKVLHEEGIFTEPLVPMLKNFDETTKEQYLKGATDLGMEALHRGIMYASFRALFEEGIGVDLVIFMPILCTT